MLAKLLDVLDLEECQMNLFESDPTTSMPAKLERAMVLEAQRLSYVVSGQLI